MLAEDGSQSTGPWFAPRMLLQHTLVTPWQPASPGLEHAQGVGFSSRIIGNTEIMPRSCLMCHIIVLNLAARGMLDYHEPSRAAVFLILPPFLASRAPVPAIFTGGSTVCASTVLLPGK
jgi:hypothetical protein